MKYETVFSFISRLYPELTPKKIALKIGVTGPAVSNWMSGEKSIPLSRADQINQIQPFSTFGVDSLYLKEWLESEADGYLIITVLLMLRRMDTDDLIDPLPIETFHDSLEKSEQRMISADNEVEKEYYEAKFKKFKMWEALKEARDEEKRKENNRDLHAAVVKDMNNIEVRIIDVLSTREDLLETDDNDVETFIIDRIFTKDGGWKDGIKEIIDRTLSDEYEMDDLSSLTENLLLETLKKRIKYTTINPVSIETVKSLLNMNKTR